MTDPITDIRQFITDYHRWTAISADKPDNILYLPADLHACLCSAFVKRLDDTQSYEASPHVAMHTAGPYVATMWPFRLTIDIYPASVGQQHEGPCVWVGDMPVMVAPVDRPTVYNGSLNATFAQGDKEFTYLCDRMIPLKCEP